MTPARVNVHATAIVVGGTGLLFVGRSGSGKSITAFDCMVAARRSGMSAALVADDQVFLSRSAAVLIGSCPEAIAGLIEIRGSGIARVPHVTSAPLHLAVLVVGNDPAERLPAPQETYDVPGLGSLPMLRLVQGAREPLAIISTFYADIGIPSPF